MVKILLVTLVIDNRVYSSVDVYAVLDDKTLKPQKSFAREFSYDD